MSNEINNSNKRDSDKLDKEKQIDRELADSLTADISTTISRLDESVLKHSTSTIPSNTRSDEEDRVLAKAQILGRLCEYYQGLPRSEQDKFSFDRTIFRRERRDGGFGLKGWEQEYIDIQLESLRQAGTLVRDGNLFRLTDSGKQLCAVLGA